MKYISLAIHNNELILISGMEEFASHFCYSKKQRQGVVDAPPQASIVIDDELDMDEDME
ncbi:hypothetical protein Mtc_1171 [Methanocella conradii HZ254]|uniref:Uncharacterized protein n=1 Tax=Methanocella conradii (strain DSM 24694 / JCM 17849 / CGMCC 1.5162 / HZ254) TaxID=1041930 RepID=H8I7U2_METCZ|nr:hypothetical protein [Methanocella conradii]AFC99927.1 hypothetical protein Mtc_1171 [Methanocella conradii HZ254]MDI6897274.1 hypothetical protein [Methanocella conradii]